MDLHRAVAAKAFGDSNNDNDNTTNDNNTASNVNTISAATTTPTNTHDTNNNNDNDNNSGDSARGGPHLLRLKGTNGVSTNGVTATFMFFVGRGTFWVLPSTYLLLSSQNCQGVFFSDLSKNITFAAGPISVDPNLYATNFNAFLAEQLSGHKSVPEQPNRHESLNRWVAEHLSWHKLVPE